MAMIYMREDGKEKRTKFYVQKSTVDRIVERKDELIAKANRKSNDHLMLAERWGAKAAEIEKGKLLVEERNFKLKVALGVFIGYDVLLTIIGLARYYT